MISLIVVVDSVGGSRRTMEFHRSPVRVGRGVDNEVHLPLAFVSDRHGEIQFDESGARYVDLGSTNGTFITGRRIQPHVPVPIDDVLRLEIGSIRLNLERREGVPPARPEPSFHEATSNDADLEPRARAVNPVAPGMIIHAEPTQAPARDQAEPEVTYPLPDSPGDFPVVTPPEDLPAPAGGRGKRTREPVSPSPLAPPTIFPLDDAPGLKPLPAEPPPGPELPTPIGRPVRRVQPLRGQPAPDVGTPGGRPSVPLVPPTMAAPGGSLPGVTPRRSSGMPPPEADSAPGKVSSLAASHVARAPSPEQTAELARLRTLATAFCDHLIRLRTAYKVLDEEMGIRTFIHSERARVQEIKDPTELLRYLTGSAGRVEEIKNLFDDMAAHHLAMMAAILEGARATLARVDPREYDEGKKGLLGRRGGRWEEYLEHFREFIDDDHALHAAVFGPEFADAYANSRSRGK